ncbi:MAG: hypothetical protein KGJ60_11685 [Verrucomicrobiota bacterium]|nr:hypothetical protein [Verrucomicrobiota bacterium]
MNSAPPKGGRLFLAMLCGSLAWSAQAGSLTNNFDSGADFLANGVAGTMWDGVYLGYGDVPGGIAGGDGNGMTLQANETAFAGFLTVQSTRTSWAGTDDDGFFLWKVVAGDFDVSVRNAQPFANPGYHFAGLLARAYTTNGPAWGAPFGAGGTNAENWLNITRFNEFSIGDQVRYATNADDIQISAPFNSGSTNYNTETNDDRYFRITRVGDTFSFYDKTNQSDAWVLETNITQPDLDGLPMKVGIEDAAFSSATPTTYFTDFELSGPNVNPAVTPPSDPAGLTAAVTNSAQVTYSWTPGAGSAGSAGSLLVIRLKNPLVLAEKPVNGFAYSGNTNFMSGDTLGTGIYAVYAGSGSSVTITGLGSVVDTNYAAVYSYSGSGSSIVYGTNPATATATGSAPVTGVTLSLSSTNLPANGAAAVQVVVTYGNGTTVTNPASGVTLASSDATVAVTANGAVSAVGIGSAAITATYGGLSDTNFVSVHSPVFADNFSGPQDFVTNGLPGSTWDGLHDRPGDVPGGADGGDTMFTAAANAGISSNNTLTVSAGGTTWEGASDDGFYLFKNVPGDFQAVVHVDLSAHGAYQFAGLLARAANADGGPYLGSENYVANWFFDQYGVTTSARETINGVYQGPNDQTGATPLNTMWLLLQRADGTNFYCYSKQNATDPWTLNIALVQPALTNGVPVEVGLAQSTYTPGPAETVRFDGFTLDAADISGGTPPSPTTGLTVDYDPTNNTMTLTWTPGTNSDGSVDTSIVVMRQGAPVSAQPYYGVLTSGNSVFGQGTDLGSGNYVVYRGSGNTVTVSGLTAGAVYYAAVYGYSGAGSTKSVDEAGSSSAAVQAGIFTGISASLTGGIPLGGVGLPEVMGLLEGGGSVDVSSSVTVTSENTNVVLASSGVLTGVAPGSATNTVTFVSGTNVFSTNLVATVRAPGYTDNFGVNHDYLAAGVTNTTWDGVYEYPKFTIPDTTFVSDPAAQIFSADANITSNGVLSVSSENVGWEFAQNDGFFLYKWVPGDFQVAVHLDMDTNNILSYDNPGLLARAYRIDTNGLAGAPFGGTNGEAWVSWTRFDQYGIGTYARYTLNNATARGTQLDAFDGQYWLLMVRRHGTNFLFYQRQNPTDPWTPAPNGTTYSLGAFAGAPMQVGILAGAFVSGNQVVDQFDSFMLDAAPSAPAIIAGSSAGNINLRWPTGGSFTLESTPTLNPPNWQPVPVTLQTNNGMNTVALPATNATLFFRLVQ